MDFVGYGTASVRGVKVDWDVEVELTEDLLQSLAAHVGHPTDCRFGILRRPFHHEPRDLGRRSKRNVKWHPPKTVHPKGAIIVALPDDSWFLIQAASS